jgi:hypothetical protein
MRNRRINAVLWSATAVFAAGAVAVMAWAVLAPLPVTPAAGAPRDRARMSGDGRSALPAIESFEAVWQVRLRRPLVDGEPELAAGAVPTPASGTAPPLTLVGTIGTSLAMLRTPSAQVEVRGVGEQLLGAEVVAVRPAQVDLRYNGQVVTLSKPPERATDR